MANKKATSSFQKYVEATPTITTSAYATGDLVGTAVIQLTDAVEGDALQKGTVGGLIQSVIITDLASQSAALDVIFFDANPSNTTFTDNAAFDIDDLDLVNIIGFAQVTSYAAFADNSVGQDLQLAIPFVLDTSNILYAAIVSRGTPTYTGTTDLTIRVGILRG